MPELTKDDYLKVGQYVFLKGKWRVEGPRYLEDELYKVDKVETFRYRRAYIIKSGETGTLDLNDDLKLYPLEYDTLYEIGVGLEGNVKLFPLLPSDRLYYYLESEGRLSATQISPTTELGGFTDKDIPPVDPKVLREYTIRDMRDKIKYVIANVSYRDEKVILDFTVNKIKLADVTDDEKATINSKLDEYISSGLLRIIRYPREG